jgi:hypothetical protein
MWNYSQGLHHLKANEERQVAISEAMQERFGKHGEHNDRM